MHYIEKLRTEHMKSGHCELCGRWTDILERHHEQYRPERTIYICHNCHHKCHFFPWQLSTQAKEKLLTRRHGFKKTITPDMIAEYTAPGRRNALMEVKAKAKQKAKQRKNQAVTL